MATLSGYEQLAVVNMGVLPGEKKPCHFALYDDNIQIGDTIIVTGSSKGKLLIVEDIVSASAYMGAIAEVIAKVDATDYYERIERRKRADELQMQMAKKRREIDERKDDMYYAELDSDYADLLSELNEVLDYSTLASKTSKKKDLEPIVSEKHT